MHQLFPQSVNKLSVGFFTFLTISRITTDDLNATCCQWKNFRIETHSITKYNCLIRTIIGQNNFNSSMHSLIKNPLTKLYLKIV